MKGSKRSKNQFKIRKRVYRRHQKYGGWAKWIARKRKGFSENP